jgi:hypothetical protein
VKAEPWTLLAGVQQKCLAKGVGFTLVYSEPQDAFYFVINSAAPGERYVGRTASLQLATERVLEWLERL